MNLKIELQPRLKSFNRINLDSVADFESTRFQSSLSETKRALSQVALQVQDLSEILIQSSAVQILAQNLASEVRQKKPGETAQLSASSFETLNTFLKTFQVSAVPLNAPPYIFKLFKDDFNLENATRLSAQLDFFHQKLLMSLQSADGLEQNLLSQYQFTVDELKSISSFKFETLNKIISTPAF